MSESTSVALHHVLLSSYACDPTEGSEPGVGWQILRAAAKCAERVTLVTRSNNVDVVLAGLDEHERSKVQVVGFDVGRFWLRAKKRLPFGVQIYYSLWQRHVADFLQDLHASDPADLVHHATFAVDWAPFGASRAFGNSDVPVVLGPVGGATRAPLSLLAQMGLKGAVADLMRDLNGAIGRRRHLRPAAKQAALVLAQNDDDYAYLSPFTDRLLSEPNAFIDLSTIPARSKNADPHLIVGVGRLIGWKGWALALRALRELPDEYHLKVFGDGPDRRRLEALARKLGVSDRVEWMGHRPRHESFESIAVARCVIHPSLHDSAPGSVAEALSIGCPVVCLDLGGAAEMVRACGGTPVPADGRRTAELLAQSVREIYEPTNLTRWDRERVCDLLEVWYAQAMENVRGEISGNH